MKELLRLKLHNSNVYVTNKLQTWTLIRYFKVQIDYKYEHQYIYF